MGAYTQVMNELENTGVSVGVTIKLERAAHASFHIHMSLVELKCETLIQITTDLSTSVYGNYED